MVDRQAPAINCPGNVSVSASSPTGAVANFTVTATDACQGSVTVSCVPASGSVFANGTNSVVCTAADAGGRSVTCTFAVIVTTNAVTARSMKQDCLVQLIAFRNTVTNANHRNKLDQAIDDVQDSIESDQWIDGDHLQRKHGDRVFREEKEAADTLLDLAKNAALQSALESVLDCITTADRRLATTVLDEAQGARRNKIKKARQEIDKGDDAVARASMIKRSTTTSKPGRPWSVPTSVEPSA